MKPRKCYQVWTAAFVVVCWRKAKHKLHEEFCLIPRSVCQLLDAFLMFKDNKKNPQSIIKPTTYIEIQHQTKYFNPIQSIVIAIV